MPTRRDIFIGFDDRQHAAYTALQHSIIERASKPVAITPLVLNTLPIERRGLTPFTYSRFLVPWLCKFENWAMFLDIDMLVLGDVDELFSLADSRHAVMVAPTKQRFERTSMILFNCAHPANAVLTPDFVQSQIKLDFHGLGWLNESDIGFLGSQWNHIVGTDAANPAAKIVHFTQGIPLHPELVACEFASEWHAAARATQSSMNWAALMGHSVWSCDLGDGRVLPKSNPEVVALQMQAEREINDLCEQAYNRERPSPRYFELEAQYRQMHTEGATEQGLAPEDTFDGRSLGPHIQAIRKLTLEHGAKTLLDYGSGKGRLYQQVRVQDQQGKDLGDVLTFWGIESLACFDFGVEANASLPEEPKDAVISTDVLEHCATEDMPWIVAELFAYARHFVYAAVANYPAHKTLPNGENAHVTLRSRLWWELLFRTVSASHPGIRYTVQVVSTHHADRSKRVISHFSG